MIKLRLDNTRQVDDERFVQKWTITDHDGSKHVVTSDSEWRDISIKRGGNKIFDVDGTPVNSGQMIATAISCGLPPTSDDGEYEINDDWVNDVEANGVNRKYLADPID